MHGETIYQLLRAAVGSQGSKIAISFLREGLVETKISYAQLLEDVDRFANTLLGIGVQKGDRVILFLPKSLIAVVAHFAVLAVGGIVVPLNPGFTRNEMTYLLEDSNANLVIVDPEKKSLILESDPGARLLEVPASGPYQETGFFRSASGTLPAIQIAPNDPALIIYTSGTTGNPKGAVLTHKNLICDARNIIDIWKIRDSDVLCHALPLFHVHGLCFALHTVLFSGGRVQMMAQFKPEVVAEELSRKTGDTLCTVFMAVPSMYTKLMDFIGDRILDLGHLRLITSGSAPLPISEFERITRVFGREPVEREGMSETGMNFSNPVDGRRVPGSIGLPLHGVQVRIVDPRNATDVAPGDIGEIWLKSDSITPGYFRKPGETADAFMDGWFRTGDLGKKDADGYYYLTDRIKHIIITGGENVSAKEVETIINRIENVAESAVVGIPDEKWGEKVVAAVTAKPKADLTEADIKDFCRANLHAWKCPKHILFIREIPRNTMGKVLKEEVKKIFAGKLI